MDAAERRRRWELVLPHRAYLASIALRRGMSWHDAEDCAQEAMLRAVGFPDLDETRVAQFLATTTKRLCVDRHRVHVRDARLGARLVPWHVDEPSPEERACERDEAAWVVAHLEALPESQRAALAARAEGLSGHEIAARLGLSYKAVESLLSRARAYVRTAVATVWVLLARARRRGLDAPDNVGTMTMAALVTVTALVSAHGGAYGPRDVALPRAWPVAARPGTSAVPVPFAAVPVAAGTGPPAPHPTGSPTPAPSGSPAPTLPLPTAVPTDPCDLRLDHAELCVPVDDYRPGEALGNCLRNGIDVSRGVECRTDPRS